MMSKSTILLALTVLLANNALATTWHKFAPDFADEKGLYIDTDSIVQNTAGERSFLLKRTYHNPQAYDDKNSYVAQFVNVQADCNKFAVAGLSTAFYDAQFQQIAHIANPLIAWQSVEPSSGVGKRLSFVCQYDLVKPQ